MSDHTDALQGVSPKLLGPVQRIQEATRLLGFPLRVLEGVRSDERQQALVTQCDGVTHRSRHQTQADGFGHAVDLVWDTDTPFEGPWPLLGAAAVALGL